MSPKNKRRQPVQSLVLYGGVLLFRGRSNHAFCFGMYGTRVNQLSARSAGACPAGVHFWLRKNKNHAKNWGRRERFFSSDGYSVALGTLNAWSPLSARFVCGLNASTESFFYLHQGFSCFLFLCLHAVETGPIFSL